MLCFELLYLVYYYSIYCDLILLIYFIFKGKCSVLLYSIYLLLIHFTNKTYVEYIKSDISLLNSTKRLKVLKLASFRP